MRIVCGQCGATYRIEGLPRTRRVRCKACEGIIAIGAAKSRAPDGAEDAPPLKRKRAPATALVVAAVSLLLGLFYALATLFVWGVDTGSSLSEAVARGGLVFVLIVPLALAACLLVAAIGLFLAKPWGWWMAVVMQSFGLLLNGKFALTYFGALNWEHRDARAIALLVAQRYGVPALVALAMLVLLFLPGVRKAYGMRQEPYRRRPGPARRR